MIRQLGEAAADAIVESVGRAVGRSQEQRPLPADLLESEDAYLAVFDAPGVEAGDVQVRFEHNTVHVRVDRFRDFYEDFEMRFPGRGLTLDGSVDLPDDAVVDADGATATLKANGTLQVEIPKVELDEESDETEDEHEADDDEHEAEDADADEHDAGDEEHEADEEHADADEGTADAGDGSGDEDES